MELNDAALRLLRYPEDHAVVNKQGQQMSEIVDTRGAAADVELRNFVLAELIEQAERHELCGVVGMATSGILWGALLAHSQGLPYLTVLPEGPRPHGLRRQVEGEIKQGVTGTLLLVDNWIVSGNSVKKATKALSETYPTLSCRLLLVVAPDNIPNVGIPVDAAFSVRTLRAAAFHK